MCSKNPRDAYSVFPVKGRASEVDVVGPNDGYNLVSDCCERILGNSRVFNSDLNLVAVMVVECGSMEKVSVFFFDTWESRKISDSLCIRFFLRPKESNGLVISCFQHVLEEQSV